MPNKDKSPKKQPKEPTSDAETIAEIRRKEIDPHRGGTIGPSPYGNVQDSHLPPRPAR